MWDVQIQFDKILDDQQAEQPLNRAQVDGICGRARDPEFILLGSVVQVHP